LIPREIKYVDHTITVYFFDDSFMDGGLIEDRSNEEDFPINGNDKFSIDDCIVQLIHVNLDLSGPSNTGFLDLFTYR